MSNASAGKEAAEGQTLATESHGPTQRIGRMAKHTDRAICSESDKDRADTSHASAH